MFLKTFLAQPEEKPKVEEAPQQDLQPKDREQIYREKNSEKN